MAFEKAKEYLEGSYVCSSYGEKFRLNSSGCDKIYYYYCGKEITR